MRMYLSGWHATTRERELAVIKSGGLKHRCFSYAALQKIPGLTTFQPNLRGSYESCTSNGVGIMMDSGVFSFRSLTEKLNLLNDEKSKKTLAKLCTLDQYIEQYVEYVKANKHEWDFYVTIDTARVSKEIFATTKRLCKMGIKPVPVFHGDASVDYIQRYADEGHKLICIGLVPGVMHNRKLLRRYLDAVFNIGTKLGLDYHGLAMTSPSIMMDFPWWSVDSSSWSRAAGYGSIMRFDAVNKRLSTLHISLEDSKAKGNDLKLNHVAMKGVKEELEAEGADFHLLQTDFVARHVYNAKTMTYMAEHAHKSQEGQKWNLLF